MKKLLGFALLFLSPLLAYAAGTEVTVDPTASAYSYLYAATGQIANNLQSMGIKLFFVLTLLQFVITGYGLVGQGEIDASFGKYAKALLWVSFCLYLMTNQNAANLIGNTLSYFLNHAIGWASGDVTAKFNVGGVLQTGIQAIGSATTAIAKASVPTPTMEKMVIAVLMPGATAAAALGTIIYATLMTALIYIIIIGVCGYISLKIFMVKIEAALLLAILPLSLSFLGLSALRDQGFAPFKHMLALIYRIVILGAIVGGLAGVSKQMLNYANSASDPNVLEVSLLSVFGFVILAFLAHKSDAIASSLASGSATLGSGDLIGAAMSGAAAGGIAGAATGAAGGSVKSMADVMKGMTGGGSMSNASSRGTGGSNQPEPAPSRPLASMNSGSGSGAPKRSASTGGNSGSSSASASGGSASAQSSTGGSSAPSQDSAGSSSASPSSSSSASSAGDTSSSSSAPSRSAAGNESGSGSSASSSIPQQPMNSGVGESGGIGGAPQRAGGQQPEPTTAPRKETNGEKLKRNANELGKRVEKENTSTSVSLNTHHTD